MALSCFVDAFNIGTGALGTTVARSGYGFQPKACLYWWAGRLDAVDAVGLLHVRCGIGAACTPTDRCCVSTYIDHGSASAATARTHYTTECIVSVNKSAVVDANADLQSFDSDGQTLVIDDAFVTAQNVRVHCLAVGGSDLTNVATVQFQAPTTTGNADVTSLSFQPDALVLFSVGHPTVPAAATTTARLSLGVVAGGQQGVAAYEDVNGLGTTDTASYNYGGECVALFTNATTINFRAAFVSFLSNGFRLNWLEVDGSTQPYVVGLALKGGSYLVGNLLTQTDTVTTMVESGFGFQPTGVLLLSSTDAQSTQDSPGAHARMSIGAFTSPTNRGVQACMSQDASANSNAGSTVQHDACYARVTTAGALDALMDVQSVDSDGFTGIMDDADVAQAYVTYLAFGNAGVAFLGDDDACWYLFQEGA